MKWHIVRAASVVMVASLSALSHAKEPPNTVALSVADVTVQADLIKPPGPGPFPAVLWNHGGVNPRPGVSDYEVSSVLGELFSRNGYVLLLPHRRGYGRSPRFALAEQFVGEKIAEERNRIQLALMDAYADEITAAVAYLGRQSFVDPKRIVVAGCSFGGSLAMFAGERNLPIRAVINFAGGAVSWKQAPDLRERMLTAARRANVPVLLVQAENDHDLDPTRALARELSLSKKPHQVLMFPAHGTTAREGHNFCETGGAVWQSGVMSFLSATIQ